MAPKASPLKTTAAKGGAKGAQESNRGGKKSTKTPAKKGKKKAAKGDSLGAVEEGTTEEAAVEGETVAEADVEVAVEPEAGSGSTASTVGLSGLQSFAADGTTMESAMRFSSVARDSMEPRGAPPWCLGESRSFFSQN